MAEGVSDKEKLQIVREAAIHLLEVQVKPSTEYRAEWRSAVDDMRRALRKTKPEKTT